MLTAAIALALVASVESGPTVSQDTAPAPKVWAAHKHVPSDSPGAHPAPQLQTSIAKSVDYSFTATIRTRRTATIRTRRTCTTRRRRLRPLTGISAQTRAATPSTASSTMVAPAPSSVIATSAPTASTADLVQTGWNVVHLDAALVQMGLSHFGQALWNTSTRPLRFSLALLVQELPVEEGCTSTKHIG